MLVSALSTLEAKLKETVEAFQEDVKFHLETMTGEPTKADLEELGKHVFYALRTYQSSLIEYLRATKD